MGPGARRQRPAPGALDRGGRHQRVSRPWAAPAGASSCATEADPATPWSAGDTDGDVQLVYPVGNQVLVGGHFTRFYNRPDPATGTSITLRCQMFAVAVDDPTNLLAVTEPAELCPLRAVRRGGRGHQRRRHPRQHLLGRPARPADPGRRPDARCRSTRTRARGSAAPALQGPWGGLWHLLETPVGDTTKPATPGAVAVSGSFTRGQRVVAGGHRCQRHRRLLRVRERRAEEGGGRQTSPARRSPGSRPTA